MNIIVIKDTVKHILTKEPETRDNDHLLQLKVWATQMPDLRHKNYKFWDFAIIYKSGKLASSESIRRCRQKLQELNPHLRGKNYKKRQAEQSNVKDQLKKM